MNLNAKFNATTGLTFRFFNKLKRDQLLEEGHN
jgi:hypothetical protein